MLTTGTRSRRSAHLSRERQGIAGEGKRALFLPHARDALSMAHHLRCGAWGSSIPTPHKWMMLTIPIGFHVRKTLGKSSARAEYSGHGSCVFSGHLSLDTKGTEMKHSGFAAFQPREVPRMHWGGSHSIWSGIHICHFLIYLPSDASSPTLTVSMHSRYVPSRYLPSHNRVIMSR